MTTVDYIIASPAATSITSSCKILAMTDLNTSDHLPLVVELAIECPVQTPPSTVGLGASNQIRGSLRIPSAGKAATVWADLPCLL